MPGYDGDYIYIGSSWANVGDDETGRQFKDRVEKELIEKLPGIKLEFETHEEAWN